MRSDLRSQLRAYGAHLESQMPALEIQHVGEPLVTLKPQTPKPSRGKIYALISAVAVLLVLLPVWMMRQQSTFAVPTTRVVLVPFGERSEAGLPSATLTLDVPDGWPVKDGVVSNGLEAPEFMNVGFWSVANVFTDRCQWRGSLVDPPPGPGVDDLANALKDVWGGDATAPSDVSLDELSGKHMTLTVPADAVFSQCDDGHFQSWMDDGNGYRWYQGPGQIERLWILDVDGERLMVAASHFPEASPEAQAELQRIIDSIQIQSE